MVPYMSTLMYYVFCEVADRVELLKLESFVVGGFCMSNLVLSWWVWPYEDSLAPSDALLG